MRVSLHQLPVQQPSKVFARTAAVQRGREAAQSPGRRDVVELSGRRQGQRKQSSARDGMLGMMQDQIATLKQRRKELVSQTTSLSPENRDMLLVYKLEIKDIDQQLADVEEQISQHMLDQMTKQVEEAADKSDSKQGSEKTADQLEAEQMGALADAHAKIQTTESLIANQSAMKARRSELSIAERNDAGLSLSGVESPASRQADMGKLDSGIHATEKQAQAVNEAADARAEQAGALGQAKAEAEAADAAAAEKAATETVATETVAPEAAPEGTLASASATIEEATVPAQATAEAPAVAVPAQVAQAEQAKARADQPALRVAVRLKPGLRA